VRIVPGWVVMLMLPGCVLNTIPYRGYVDATSSNAETSVFTAYDDRGPVTLTVVITWLDGHAYQCKAGNAGCSFWTRLTPGKHLVELHYMNMNGGLRSYQEATVTVEVDARPGTMYVARVTSTSGTIEAHAEPFSLQDTYAFPANYKGSIGHLFDN
jgi:hypothetical protein